MEHRFVSMGPQTLAVKRLQGFHDCTNFVSPQKPRGALGRQPRFRVVVEEKAGFIDHGGLAKGCRFFQRFQRAATQCAYSPKYLRRALLHVAHRSIATHSRCPRNVDLSSNSGNIAASWRLTPAAVKNKHCRVR